MKTLITPFLLLFVCIELFGQTNDSTYEKYLINKKYVPKRVYYTTDSPEILKTEIAEILDGNIPIIWEHRFTDHLGIDGGVGLIMPYSFVDFFDKNNYYHIIPELFSLNY